MAQLDKTYDTTYKVLVLGESGVGKTSIIRRFTDEKYQDSYISTIGLSVFLLFCFCLLNIFNCLNRL